jgi:hypothetical protein
VENKKIDFTLTKLAYEDDAPLAYFELKGAFSASGLSKRADGCEKDIKALHDQRKGQKGVERFFVLLLHAGSIGKAREALRHLRSIKRLAENVQEVGRPTPIRLNHTGRNNSEDQLFVFVFRVNPS